MIWTIRRIEPFISFGFARPRMTVAVGESIDVWLNTLYNTDDYGITINTTLPKVKKSNYQYTLTPAVAGEYEITFTVGTKDVAKTIELISNTIILTVVE